jgi:DNA-binding winged helix-turn-helix (wHTH) protein
MTHRLLLQKVWGPDYGTESNYLCLYVRQIRQKLADDPAHPKRITTEPGLGYMAAGTGQRVETTLQRERELRKSLKMRSRGRHTSPLLWRTGVVTHRA